tara:strand:+ start:2752 stop:3243 length:492 start_codon:yes stop_codon:yes gene_type:complete
MKIRHATLQDFDRIMELMVNFANAAVYEPFWNPEYNDNYIRRLLITFQQEGCILLAVKDQPDQPDQVDQTEIVVGMLIAHMQGDPWLPQIKTLKELAWWVEPEYRNTTAGYKLLKQYVKLGEGLTEKGKIKGFTLTNMTNSPVQNFEKFGWTKVETNYIWGGK